MRLGGLDLGRVRDHTALVVVDRAAAGYVGCSVEQWRPESDDYSDVIPVVNAAGLDALAYDATGEGRKAEQLFLARIRCQVFSVAATHGWRPAKQRWDKRGVIFVPKRDLVATMVDVITRAQGLPPFPPSQHARKLRSQLVNYRETTGPDGLPRWGGPNQGNDGHDDLVSALQHALWLGEQGIRLYQPSNSRRTA